MLGKFLRQREESIILTPTRRARTTRRIEGLGDYALTDPELYEAVNNWDECGEWNYGTPQASSKEDGWKEKLECKRAMRGSIVISW